MKTLVIFTEVPDEYPRIAVLDGDLRRLNGTYINDGDDETLEKEVLDLFYKGGELKQELFLEMPFLIEDKTFEFDLIIQCGFLL